MRRFPPEIVHSGIGSFISVSTSRNGYVDLHVTLCTNGVADQRLIYARAGHFSESVDVATVGGVTCYRLPFWHYTTPMLAKPKREASARRWVLLGTFLDARDAGEPAKS